MTRNDIVSLVRKWGGCTSDAVLDPACSIFSVPEIEGLLGYRKGPGCFVVYGDPICDPKNLPKLTEIFHQHCHQIKHTIIYISASQKFAQWALQNVCKTSIEFGGELFIDPHNDPRKATGIYASLVRRKVKQAIREGVSIHEYADSNAQLEQNIEALGEHWLENRRGPQIYISHVHLFKDREGKRWIYAKFKEKIVGVAVLNKLESRQGWLLNHLMVSQEAPNGTSELLVVTILEMLAKEGCHFVTFGHTPERELGQILGFNSFTKWTLKNAYKVVRKIFKFDRRTKFWQKFFPSIEPSYVLISQARVGIKELIALMRATNV